MIPVHGIDHIAITVKDLDRSLAFYTKLFGLQISPREHQKPGIEYFLDCGSALIGLIQGKAEEGEHLLKDGGIGGNHFSFRIKTSDFDWILGVLAQEGIPVDFFKKRERSWSIYFRDPDGNKLEMTAWPLEDAGKA